MIRLYDVDGVLLDFVGAVFRARGESREPVLRYDFLTANDKVMLRSPDFWETLHPMPGAMAAIDRRRAIGHDIVAVTAPWHSCKGWGFVRRHLLKKHFGIHQDNVIITHRKDLVRGDYFVDDNPDTVSLWGLRNPGGTPRLYDATYNQDAFGFKRVRWDR